MLLSLKSENETLHADHEDLISKLQSSEREWIQRYNDLTEELRAQKAFQLQTQGNYEMTEGELLLPESAQNSEPFELRKRLSEAQPRIALLEAELSATSRREVITLGTEMNPLLDDSQGSEARPHLSPTPPPRTKLISNTDSLEPLPEFINSPITWEYAELLRRHNATRLIIEDLLNKNASLNKELSSCKQDLTSYQSKLAEVSEELKTERVLHAENLEDYRKEIQGLQYRITDLLGDRDRYETLTAELNQSKENELRFKRKHTCQLQTPDRMLQERDRAICDLTTGRTAPPEEIYGKVTIEEVCAHSDTSGLMEQGVIACNIPSSKPIHSPLGTPVRAEGAICAEETASEIEDPVQDVVYPLHISGGILDKTIQELQVALTRLQSEISVVEAPELCPMSRGDEGDWLTTVTFHSADRLKEVRSIIQSLLSHFNSIRAMKLSLSRTVNRNLLVNASAEVGCDLRQIHSVVLSLKGGDEEVIEEENVLTLSHSTVDMTTIEHLKGRDDEIIAEKDAEAMFKTSREDVKSSEVSVIEARNRVFFDRVALAVAKIQDAVEDFSFRAAKEVLTALASQPVKDVRKVGNGDNTEGDDKEVERTQTQTKTRAQTPSGSADTLADISRPHTGFSEIAEEAIEKSILSKSCYLRNVTPVRAFHDINITLVNELLTRFVDMTKRIQTLAEGEVRCSGGVPAPSLSSVFVMEDGIQGAFAEWSAKGREWFGQFVAALQNASMLPLVQSNLEQLEREVIDNFSHLKKVKNETEPRFQEKNAHPSLMNSIIPQEDYEALATKCDRLSVLNVELQNAHVFLSEEWSAARRHYEATIADLCATCDELRSELERFESTARDQSSRIGELEDRLTEANTHVASLLEELNQTKATIMSLRELLEQAGSEVSRHRSELEQFMLRAKSIVEVDGTTLPPSLIAVFDCLLASLESRIQSAVEEEKQEEEGRIQSLTSSFEVKVSGLEEEMQKQVEAHESRIKHMKSKYSSLLESSQSKYAVYEERCETLAFREQELNAELATREVELEHLRQDYHTLQAEVDMLRHRAMNAERAISEGLAEKARKYPELKVIAADLKSRLFKRAELLEHSLNEAKRLRRIIQENGLRAKEFLVELERLRAQILAKNSSIRQLERLAQQCSCERVKPSPRGRKFELDPPKSPSSECPEQASRQASVQVTTPSTNTNVSGGEEEPDTLCSVTRRSFLIDSTHKSATTTKTASTKTLSAITVPLAVTAKEDEVARTVSSGLVYSAPQCIGAASPLLLEPYGVEPLRRRPPSTATGGTISVVEVDHDEELDGSVEGVTRSFDGKEEASLNISLFSLKCDTASLKISCIYPLVNT
ncbi:hypothetical protein TcWFU_008515 [Taenia crassiceps]|uniref:DUF5741 domain-containing protein n=1 Tax=Taenia crassiceps TaxID=6207 RepID=A0ABR4Q795_9CEST